MLGEGSQSHVLAIVAALNEEEGIGLTIAEFRKYVKDPRILVIDGKVKTGPLRALQLMFYWSRLKKDGVWDKLDLSHFR